MKFGAKPPVIWHESKELKNSFSRLNSQLSRLLLLDNLWDKILGNKAKFWVLEGAQGGIIFVKVKTATAKHELALKEKELIKELNKNFERSWIKKISVI